MGCFLLTRAPLVTTDPPINIHNTAYANLNSPSLPLDSAGKDKHPGRVAMGPTKNISLMYRKHVGF